MEIAVFILIILALCFYFLPALIAGRRKAEHGTAIFLVNFLFGWTVLGWIAALIWAVVEDKQAEHVRLKTSNINLHGLSPADVKICPECQSVLPTHLLMCSRQG